MRLGLSAQTYRWVAFPWMRVDRPEFRATSHHAPYDLTVEPPDGIDDLPDWLLERALAHDLTALSLDVGWLGDAARAREFGAWCADAGVQVLGAVSVNLAADPECWQRPAAAGAWARFDPARATSLRSGWDGDAEASIAAAAMSATAAAGAPLLSLVHGEPGRVDRFARRPSLAVQLARIERNVRSLLPLARDLGLTLAVQPHMDYRCAELVEVVERVDSPHLRLVFDTAAPLAANEDPLEAARRAAPFTAATHLRDMRVQALTEIASGAFFHAPIGEGHVPIQDILRIMQQGAPDPDGLTHCLETVTRPEHDVEAWLTASLATVRGFDVRE